MSSPQKNQKNQKNNTQLLLNTQPPLFKQVCVIGLGLIGASLAQAIKDNGLSQRLVAVDRHAPSIEEAIKQGLLEMGSSSLSDVVAGSDLIVIAVPVQAVRAVFADIKQAMDKGQLATDCMITDVCSTKANIIDAAKAVFTSLPTGFVPAHPIAGAENSGYHARRANLFVNHSVIICELPTTNYVAIAKLRMLWEAVGQKQCPWTLTIMMPYWHIPAICRIYWRSIWLSNSQVMMTI